MRTPPGTFPGEAVLAITQHQPSTRPHAAKSRIWRWGIVIFAVALIPLIVLQILIARADPILKGRVIETLRTRFGSDVQLDSLHVSISKQLSVTGTGLRILPPPEVVAAGYTTPVIAIGRFDFEAPFLGLIFKPMHIGSVRVRNLAINVPPADVRRQAGPRKRHLGKVKIKVDTIVCDDSQLVIGTDKPNKDPRTFRLKHVVLRDVGPDGGWPFDALLTNPIPRGEIHAVGAFGPWNTGSPGDSKVNGKYQFEHADLNTIKGLGGILQSTGTFDGQLDRIAVRGQTWVPNFSLDTANHTMPLSTRYSAVVDGTTGDTYLKRIDATLGGSQFSCSGAVINEKGRGHNIKIKVDLPDGNIQDFLKLAVKSEPAEMSGLVTADADLDIEAGDDSVSQRMKMKGSFTLRQIHFTNPALEDKIDILSLRARGKTDDLKSGAPDVTSNMTGEFDMRRGELSFSRLDYSLPGGELRLSGTYTLEGRKYDFVGHVRTRAEISKMVVSKWKSILLTPLDPFFSKHGWGAEIPVRISGANGKPKFGLHF
jgi:hypothetical protein